MFPQVFEIDLDQDSKYYVAGQLITGKVVIVLQREKAVKGITVRLLGRGYVYWEGGISGINHNTYTETEDYVDIKTKLLYREDGKEQILEAGHYQYNFSVQLPPNLPSSIESKYGHIRYSVEASIQRSWKDDHTTVIPNLLIRALTNLNCEPKAREPVKIIKEKYIGLMFCQNGPLSVNFLFSKAGFVPGEYLQFCLEVRNTVNIRINAVVVTLKSHIAHKVGSEKKSHAEKVFQCVGPSVEAKGYLVWGNHFQIPDLPPNPLEKCNVMELKYFLELKLVLERWTDFKLCTPVIIGSIPYSISERHTVEQCKLPLPPIAEEGSVTSPYTTMSTMNTNMMPPISSAFAVSAPTQTISMNEASNVHTIPGVPTIPMTVENPEYGLPCLGWGSHACLAEIEKITSRPVQTVPSFLLSASENLYAMSMGSCDKLSKNYEILDDRHILFEDEEAFVDMCSAKLENMFLREENGHGH